MGRSKKREKSERAAETKRMRLSAPLECSSAGKRADGAAPIPATAEKSEEIPGQVEDGREETTGRREATGSTSSTAREGPPPLIPPSTTVTSDEQVGERARIDRRTGVTQSRTSRVVYSPLISKSKFRGVKRGARGGDREEGEKEEKVTTYRKRPGLKKGERRREGKEEEKEGIHHRSNLKRTNGAEMEEGSNGTETPGEDPRESPPHSNSTANCNLLAVGYGQKANKDLPITDRAQERQLRKVQIERDTLLVESTGYKNELAKILMSVSPSISMEATMAQLLHQLEIILASFDYHETEIAQIVESEWSLKQDLQRSMEVIKGQDDAMSQMHLKSTALQNELDESKEAVALLQNCFTDVSLKVVELEKSVEKEYGRPFTACSKSERDRRVNVVDRELDRVVGRECAGVGRDVQKLNIIGRLRRRLRLKEELIVEKWSTEQTMQLQYTQGWSDTMLERFRSVLVQNGMNFLAPQRALREFRKRQWNTDEWAIRYDEKDRIVSQQYTNIRRGLTEQLQRCELSGNLNRSQWDGHVGYCIVFDAGGGTTKVAGTVMNSIQPNSVDHISLLGMYKGNDGYDEMKKNMDLVIGQVNDLITNPEIEITNSQGRSEILHIDVLITADYKALCYMMGHKGPCSLFNCFICKRKSGRTEQTGQVLIGDESRLKGDVTAPLRDLTDYVDPSHSVDRPPLFKIALDHIIPPALHMMLGLIKPFIEFLENELFQKDMREMGYCNVSAVDEAKAKLVHVKEENDCSRDILENMRMEREWMERAQIEMKEGGKGSVSKRSSKNYCSPNCLMRAKTLKSLPLEYRETMRCRECQNMIHLFCYGALTLSTIEIRKLSPTSFRCHICRKETIESRLEEIGEMITAIDYEIEDYEERVRKGDDELRKLTEVIYQNMGPNRLKFEQLLEQLRISRQKYFNAFNGNDVKRLLKGENVDKLFSLSSHSKKNEIVTGMKALGRIMGAAKAKILKAGEIEAFKNDVEVYKTSMTSCFPEYRVTPKCHLLLTHVVPFIEKWHTWGLASEQAIESMHATVNTIMRRYYNVRNEEHKWMLVTRELSMRRKLRDRFTVFE